MQIWVSGLQGNTSITVDFSTQLQRIISLGFNTIELPFSFKSLLGGNPTTLPNNCTVTTYQQLKVSHSPAASCLLLKLHSFVLLVMLQRPAPPSPPHTRAFMSISNTLALGRKAGVSIRSGSQTTPCWSHYPPPPPPSRRHVQ